MDAKQLKSFRKMMGYSQDELATMLGFSRRSVQLMENGENEIRKATALACAAIALGVHEYKGPADNVAIQLPTRTKKDH